MEHSGVSVIETSSLTIKRQKEPEKNTAIWNFNRDNRLKDRYKSKCTPNIQNLFRNVNLNLLVSDFSELTHRTKRTKMKI